MNAGTLAGLENDIINLLKIYVAHRNGPANGDEHANDGFIRATM
jgi:hypothetical protein